MYKKLQILMLLLGMHASAFSMEARHAAHTINSPLSPATITALQEYKAAEIRFRTIQLVYQNLRWIDTNTQDHKDTVHKFHCCREELRHALDALIATDHSNIKIDTYGSITRKFFNPNGSVSWIPIERYNQAREDTLNQALAIHKKRSCWSWFR